MACDLVVYGAGGMGQEIVDLVHCPRAGGPVWNLIGFVDDDAALHGTEVFGLPVLGGFDWLATRTVAVSVALGAPAARRRAAMALAATAGASSRGRPPSPVLVHPAAYVGEGADLGEGTVVAAHATLTADVRIGRFAIVNAGATVSHNARLRDFATVAPGAHLAGAVRLGEGADVGIGASVVQGRAVGEWSVVGAGAVVIVDAAPNTTVVGCPARVVAERPPGWHE
ncbi:MAG TPA: NeuD/PglB/VioB family sugar acetyltransferase [Acidimicrobiales bacterium]|nr:NeuD/PglB/VioB family sugar acetyltransferase [Acidimicrobiales bacterium]